MLPLDAHIHLWRRDDGEDFWMRDKIPALDRDFTESDLRAARERCGVGGAIAVQAMHNVGESRRLLEAARTSDQIAGVVAWCDLADQGLEDVLAGYLADPNFVGVRPLPPTRSEAIGSAIRAAAARFEPSRHSTSASTFWSGSSSCRTCAHSSASFRDCVSS